MNSITIQNRNKKYLVRVREELILENCSQNIPKMSTCNLYMTVLIDVTFMAEMLPEALKLLQFNILNGKTK